ncbi:MAG: pantoate--beta-alanine ligase [Nocardioides sp.]
MSGLALASTREELAHLLAPARDAGRRVGLVPTMGALHAGHASLMRTAREAVTDGPVVASVFVNPLQFGAGEDLDRYPRTLDADLALCADKGVDVVFAPSVEEVYPGGVGEPGVTVEPGPLATVLEGATRPGHFRGVLTVVAKLFGLVRPDLAVFGLKDFQQFALICRMVSDLCLDVEVLGADTVREPDGLALSSRNRFLDAEQRRQALVLIRALRAAQAGAHDGIEAALAAGWDTLAAEPAVDVDYLVATAIDLDALPDVVPPGTTGRVLVAAKIGSTRMIDNLPILLGS